MRSTDTIRSRIRELRYVPARELMPNEKNWRRHPPGQRAALEGVLGEIGYAQALLARQTADGQLVLIDGHLRAETTPDQEVPVLILDVDEAEAAKLLATSSNAPASGPVPPYCRCCTSREAGWSCPSTIDSPASPPGCGRKRT
jgi:hypothetical protein